MLSQHDPNVPIKSSPFQAGWAISGRSERVLFNSKGKKRGYILLPDAVKHREFKAKRGKKAVKTPPEPPVYHNVKMSPWQKDMARYMHAGYNIVADVVTSCGKTWAANLITAWEVLSRDTSAGAKATALIISPNSEVMRDTVKDICENHTKDYAYGVKVLVRTLTRNFTTYDEKFAPDTQLMVVSVECVEEFITDPINAEFVDNLQIIVFDEVHMNSVTRCLWWSQYIPHTAQLVLLSATLGDPEAIKNTVEHIQSLQEFRPRETKIIKYSVRPIALQPLLFNGCARPSNGVYSKELKAGKKLACVVNRYDPTYRDLASLLGPDDIIPEGRDAQYELGQQVISKHIDVINSKLDEALEHADVSTTPENVYTLLAYLFANDKQPVMVFNTTAGATEDMARKLVSHIASLEETDPEFTIAQKQFKVYEKEHYRARDKQEKNKKDEWTAVEDQPVESINIHEVRGKLSKWKFPSSIEIPDKIPQWIRDCLEYGIGVYVSTMKVWQRHIMFDAFREGKIQVLLSDSTISVGINLPIRTVIMCGRISHTLYKQASGRAGRRGMDTQGYIVHLMDKQDIKKCLTTQVPEVYLKMPTHMNHSDLIRVLVPNNLDTYYAGGDEKFLQAGPLDPYKETILNNYLGSLTEPKRMHCLSQIALLRKEQWHYHRLTNLIKNLPEAGSILVIKLLTQGVLHKMSVVELIDLFALLFYRIESESISTDYYLPSFPSFPEMYEKLQKFANAYGVDIDFKKPVHHYFSEFCRKQIVHMEYLPELESIGEWLYILKRGVTAAAPSKSTKTGKNKYGKNQFRVDQCDAFAKMIVQIDRDYLAARTHCSV
jgi:superfamily II DNA or RNA helicase